MFNKYICKILIICFTLSFTTSVFSDVKIKAKCLNEDGKMSDCSVENTDGNLIVTYKSKKESNLNKKIEGEKIQKLTQGEFAKRRVGTAVALGILVNPLALFTLFSKKKVENFGIEYFDDKGKRDGLLVQTDKKGSFAMKNMLSSVSGKEIEIEEVETKTKEQAKAK